MATEYVDDEHRLMRHVPWARVRKDNEGRVVGINAQAYAMRPTDEYLSASWVEFFSAQPDPVSAAATAFQAVRTIKPKDRFAIGVVKAIKTACLQCGCHVRVTREPLDNFGSHSGVRQFPNNNDDLLELLAAEAWAQLHPPV